MKRGGLAPEGRGIRVRRVLPTLTTQIKPLLTHGGYIAPSGAWDVRTERRVVPSGLRERAGCPSAETQPPVASSRPCLARAFQIFKVTFGTHDIVWPSNVQTQDVGMRASIAFASTVVQGENEESDLRRGTPPFGTHAPGDISLIAAALACAYSRTVGKSARTENPRPPELF